MVLEIVGVDADIEQVYEALLDARPAAVRELSAVTGQPPQQVRAALRRLESGGLVTRTPGTPHRYVAADPSIALEALLLEREEMLRRARARTQEVSERFRQAAAGRDPAQLVEVITGKSTIVRRVDQLQRGARAELRYFDKPPYHGGHAMPNTAELDFLRRGGQARAVYETASVAIADRKPILDTYLRAGEQARVLPSLPTKLMLVDDRLAAVPLRHDSTDTPSASFVVVHRSALLDALSELFETLWQLGLPFDAPAPNAAAPAAAAAAAGRGGGGGGGHGRDHEPDPLERQVLALMGAGLPDEAIARRLGLSHRTLQRRVRRLMDRLHASTRYQLGAQATARRWLDAGGPVAGCPVPHAEGQ